MSFLAAALPAVGSIVGGLLSGRAARRAGDAQIQSAQLGIDEQRRQFDLTRGDLAPWQQAGQAALGQQMDLLGMNGGAGQQGIIDMLLSSPQFSSLLRQGDESILQNASATGGLRGGNNISNMANFRTDLLSQLIEQQYGRLGSISGAGQQTGVQLGQMGQNSAAAIANLLGQQGAARAGGILGQASGINQAIGGFSQLAGTLFGGKGF